MAHQSNSSRDSRRQGEAKRKTPKYTAIRVIGSGSFGVVYEAVVTETNEKVAIKKVLEDRRYKNREHSIMQKVNHPNIVKLIDCFYSRGRKKNPSNPEERYLNYVMDYVPASVHDTIRQYGHAKQTMPFLYVKLYTYQICRSLAYCHRHGICHRDIKPQNLLLNPETHVVKLCDFGSAKRLIEGEPNVAYICSRYYRAPELIFEQSRYTVAIDLWSIGCVVAELFLGNPLFMAQSHIDQLVEIFKVLGSPSDQEIRDMNEDYRQYRFPSVPPLKWRQVFRNVQYNGEEIADEAIDLLSSMLLFSPQRRITAFEALGHEWFDELRDPEMALLNGRELPPLFNFSLEEQEQAKRLDIYDKIVPPHVRSILEEN